MLHLSHFIQPQFFFFTVLPFAHLTFILMYFVLTFMSWPHLCDCFTLYVVCFSIGQTFTFHGTQRATPGFRTYASLPIWSGCQISSSTTGRVHSQPFLFHLILHKLLHSLTSHLWADLISRLNLLLCIWGYNTCLSAHGASHILRFSAGVLTAFAAAALRQITCLGAGAIKAQSSQGTNHLQGMPVCLDLVRNRTHHPNNESWEAMRILLKELIPP